MSTTKLKKVLSIDQKRKKQLLMQKFKNGNQKSLIKKDSLCSSGEGELHFDNLRDVLQ